MTRADIIAACNAEITRLQRLVAAAERGPVMDWWQCDLVDWFEPDTPLYICDADTGGELVPTRVFYKVEWDEYHDGSPCASGVERIQVYMSFAKYLPATDVTAWLGDEILASLRDAACEDAEGKRDWREKMERAEARHYERME